MWGPFAVCPQHSTPPNNWGCRNGNTLYTLLLTNRTAYQTPHAGVHAAGQNKRSRHGSSNIQERDRKQRVMAFVQGDGVIRHEVLQTLSGQQIENVFYTHQSFADPGAAVIAGINAQFIAWWIAQIKPLTSVDLSLRGVRGTSLFSASSPVVETFVGSPTAGTIAQPSVPNNVAIVVTNRTGSRGRSYRGRTYQAGLPETDQTTPTAISPANAAALVVAYEALAGFLASYTASLVWGVFSQFVAGTQRTTGLFSTYTAHDANADFDSQRRRLAGRGN